MTQPDAERAENGPNVDDAAPVYVRVTVEGAAKPVECITTISRRHWDDPRLVPHPLIGNVAASADWILAYLSEDATPLEK